MKSNAEPPGNVELSTTIALDDGRTNSAFESSHFERPFAFDPNYEPGCAGPSEIDAMLDDGGCGGIDPEPMSITLAPLGRLDRIARFFWSARAYQQVFEPARNDIIHEWIEAEAAGELWKSRWISYVRGPYTLLSHMLFQMPVSICKRVLEVIRRIA